MVNPIQFASARTAQTGASPQQAARGDAVFSGRLRRELERQRLQVERLQPQTAALPQGVAFSRHAAARALERGIEVTPDLISQLAGSVERAQAKGATNILALDATRAFIINVPAAKVITAMNQEEMRENVFTNIDGAVLL